MRKSCTNDFFRHKFTRRDPFLRALATSKKPLTETKILDATAGINK